MNTIDIIIIAGLVLAIARGHRIGMLRLVFSSTGFIVGLLAGSWVAKQVALNFNSPLAKLVTIVLIELGMASAFAALAEIASLKLHKHAVRLHLGKANQLLGAGFETILTLGLVWLGTSALSNVHSYNLGQSVRRSFIVRRLDALLPQPPDILARLEKIVSPNGFPNVFLGLEPQHTTISPNNSVDNQAILAAQKSVVKIQGAGCGGIVNGSGFVADKDLVITNAHVVAGIASPQVVDQFKTYRAVPVVFDANLDIAILRINNLPDPALALTDRTLPDKNAAAVLGFPGGGPLVTNNAVIIDHIRAAGRNIYNQGVVVRNVYEVQSDIEPGNSGGPLLSPDGSVAGVIFAKSLSQDNVGYALLIDQVKGLLKQAQQQNTRVGTGICAQD
ncbi:MAG TPA: MarP family serine protease [Candidatus Limnocylindrales bacterium]|nr:MarP family serine protease [Candidatus Limnocylindrales bacterium]